MTGRRGFGAAVVLVVALVTPVAAQAPLAIDPTPRTIVGPLEGVATPFLLPSGELAIPTRSSNSIAVYGPDGRAVRSYGGRPTFPYLRSAWARGDTIEAFDIRRQMVVRFIPGGSVDSIAVERPADGATGGLRWGNADEILGPLADGWAVTAIAGVRFGARDSMSIHLLTRSGDTSRRLAVVDGMWREIYDDGSGPHPLSPTALYAVHDDELYVAESLTPIIRVLDASGALVREIAIPLTAPPASPDLTREVVDSAVALERSDPDRMPVRWSSFPAARLSAFWDFIVDELGFIWVRPYDPWQHALALDGRPGGFGGPGGRWLVASPTGEQVGWMDLPAGLEPVQITRDAVLGMSADATGAEVVRVHPLRRR